MIFTLKFKKLHNSINNVGTVLFLVYCTSSDHVLYLYQVSCKYLKEFESYDENTILIFCTLSNHILYLY